MGGGMLFAVIYGEGYCEKQNGHTRRRCFIRAPPKLLLKMRLHSRLSRAALHCAPCGSHGFFVCLFVSVCCDKFFPGDLSGHGGPNCPL